MIASVSGRVAHLGEGRAVIVVGGIGLELACTPATLARLRPGEGATLATTLVVREDSLSLYGFANEDERDLFAVLQTATGVGPRLAQAVLSVLSPDAVRRAVAAEDLVALTRVPGIGRKGAQRLVLELRDRIGAPDAGETAAVAGAPVAAVTAQVQAGLLALGYSAREVEEALSAIDPAELDVGAALRSALGWLRRR